MAGLATAGVVAGGAMVASAGVGSAAPLTGSADAVVDVVNNLGLTDVAQSDAVDAPDVDVTVNDDGTVDLSMTNPNTEHATACGLAVVSAFDVPPHGVTGPEDLPGAVYPVAGEDGEFDPSDFFTTDDLDVTTQALDPGVYAVVSQCVAWENGADFLNGVDPIGTSSNQPHYFFTLGEFGDMLS